MAVHIIPNTAAFTITQRPQANNPTIQVAGGATRARFTCQGLLANGAVSLGGDAADDPTGWALGCIQLQWIETNWAYYRGQRDADGSVFVQMARSPARVRQACRDTLDSPAQPVNDIFYGPPGIHAVAGTNVTYQATPTSGPFPIAVTCNHRDFPGETKAATRVNNSTGAINFLHEVQLEFLFCVLLAVRDASTPPNFTILKHLYWNVRWQFRFHPTDFATAAASAAAWAAPKIVAEGTGASVAKVHSGDPHDPRFANVVLAPQASNCNAVAGAAANAVAPVTPPAATPANVHEARSWQSFDVRR